MSEKLINLREGWLVLSMTYSSGDDEWIFSEKRPEYVGEAYNASTDSFKEPQVRRILWVEVEP